MFPHPGRFLGERADHLAVEAARCAEVDVLDAGRPPQTTAAQTPLQGAVPAPTPLAVNEQAEAFFKAELLRVGAFLLFAESFGHAAEAHGNEFFECWLCQHKSSLWVHSSSGSGSGSSSVS